MLGETTLGDGGLPLRQKPQTGTAGGAAEVYATQSDSGIVGNDTIL